MAKYWSFCFSISPSNKYSGLFSFMIDWFDLLAVQVTLFTNITVHNLQFFVDQPSLLYSSHPYITTRKTIALTRRNFVGKVMSLLLNRLFTFVIAFLPRNKHLLISWLQSLSAVILEPKKIKSSTVPIVSASICHEVMGSDAMIIHINNYFKCKWAKCFNQKTQIG